MTDNPVFERIQKDVNDNDVVLFMKGTAMFPQCGFSNTAVMILKSIPAAGDFETFDVLCGTEGSQVKVCTLKALVRLSTGSSRGSELFGRGLGEASSELFVDSERSLLERLMAPRAFVVRVYILEARGLLSRTAGHKNLYWVEADSHAAVGRGKPASSWRVRHRAAD